LAWLFRWLKRKKMGQGEDSAPPEAALINLRDEQKIFSPRELYRALLWQGKEAGVSRRQSETPYEYSKKLGDQLGKGTDDIATLTQAYVSSRYGEVDPEPEKLSLLNRLWRTLKEKFTNKETAQ
jgi:hypothetical protein